MHLHQLAALGPEAPGPSTGRLLAHRGLGKIPFQPLPLFQYYVLSPCRPEN